MLSSSFISPVGVHNDYESVLSCPQQPPRAMTMDRLGEMDELILAQTTMLVVDGVVVILPSNGS